MTRAQIESIVNHHAYPDSAGPATLIETHGNWVVLSDHFAFKIKKNIKFSFLDYSSREKRQFFCERELELNRRLTRNIYLRVLPICETETGPRILEKPEGPLLDHALQMVRMDEEYHMAHMLDKGQVKPEHIRQIARQLALFHQSAEKIRFTVNWQDLLEDFSDIRSTRSWVEKHLGHREAALQDAIISGVGRFLQRMAPHLQYRNNRGFTVDGHGDLHSRNIFLLDEPVFFDCIEFNDHFRRLDVLDEVAFLFMDLFYHRRPDLAESLLNEYLQAYPVIEGPPDMALFYYYLSYRANVRFKVNALQAGQSGDAHDHYHAQMYWSLLKEYFILFQKRGWF
ncbi:MAG: hypothetical protein WA004_09250 [Saprospiraceae bacterium]